MNNPLEKINVLCTVLKETVDEFLNLSEKYLLGGENKK